MKRVADSAITGYAIQIIPARVDEEQREHHRLEQAREHHRPAPVPAVDELTGSSLATAGLVASRVAPQIVFGSFAGVFVDRWDRRRTMVAVTSLAQAVTVLPLFLVQSGGAVWVAYPVLAVSAILSSFSEPAENAFLPRLVPEAELVEANALNALNNSLARLIGPALGGFSTSPEG